MLQRPCLLRELVFDQRAHRSPDSSESSLVFVIFDSEPRHGKRLGSADLHQRMAGLALDQSRCLVRERRQHTALGPIESAEQWPDYFYDDLGLAASAAAEDQDAHEPAREWEQRPSSELVGLRLALLLS